MTGLLDAVVKNSPVTIIISDNSTTGMTGGQDSHAVDRLVSICEGLGVHKDHIIRVVPLKKNHDEMVRIIRQEINYNGISVIIPTRECMQTLKRKTKANK